MVGPAILNSVKRAGELIFESLEFGVFQFRANARWGYSNLEFALVLELDEYAAAWDCGGRRVRLFGQGE